MKGVKWFIQKIFRGYSDPEVWDLSGTTAKFLLPRLKCLRGMKHGYPFMLSPAEWNKIIGKIIWEGYSFE